ncbi:MAG: hypothetical protein AB1546_15965 [bacterium]
MSVEITERQRRILNFIQSEINTKGYPPSVREIGKAAELRSTAAVLNQLRIMEKKKLIRRDPSKPRAIDLITNNGGKHGREHLLPYPVYKNTEITYKNIMHSNEERPKTEQVCLKGTILCRMEDHKHQRYGIRFGDYILLSTENILKHGDHILYKKNGNSSSYGIVEKYDQEKNKVILRTKSKNGKTSAVPENKIIGKISSIIRNL